ncbi:MAG: ribulose-phosphate 3-epimerase [Firmicutes bacterium HGW-Firmicutes-10]|nr:MAG: ribulose-phosphate 3-epimerase [Firmicutes bacterium HGW-Firmicutes-10]
MIIIAPSVLSLDYSCFEQQMRDLHASKAQWLHFDVMDGHFVPNLTFGPDILKAFRKASHLFLDVHLMVEDPEFFSDVFIDAGAQMITFHTEALDNEPQRIMDLIRKIKGRGVKAGLTVKPNTPVETLLPYIDQVDLFLIMSVEPGFGGQSFIPQSLEKIATLRKLIDQQQASALIEVDGGINGHTGQLCKQAGVDVLVAGSYVFKDDIIAAVESLC